STALSSRIVDVAIHAHLDLIHVHYAIPHAASAYMAKQILQTKGIYLPVITTLHGTDITLVGKDSAYEPVVTFSMNQSDGLTAVSESLKQDTFSHFDVEKVIEVIPNFVDFSRFNKSNKDHFKKAIAPNGERILTHVSNFRKVKRVQDVVKMFCKVAEEVPAKLLMIGDGPERLMAENLVRKMCPFNSEIRFLGKQDAVEEILSVSDLFIMPSQTESFGLAALEAMACEVPVISSNSGGIPEVNINGITGFTVEVGDVDGLAKAALKLLKDDELLTRFKAQAYEQAQRFDLTHILPLYESYYQKILDRVRI
ncbi:MAG TPA: N-acetyl-alpha-D-glucosaminyl L-malate synthase BshA, partial [Chitinophagales bacterium]|nr:N-acetyl-alpha-D-glucosaminyl L-malate synthase BshA [Chitinophagales bacterium]